jgi:hypothetical protein
VHQSCDVVLCDEETIVCRIFSAFAARVIHVRRLRRTRRSLARRRELSLFARVGAAREQPKGRSRTALTSKIVWDYRRTAAPTSGALRRRTPGNRFPVVIGEGSHPFPFRTRKLSPLPPMVLHAKVCGRVGHCRDYFCPARRVSVGLFCCEQPPVRVRPAHAQPSAGTARARRQPRLERSQLHANECVGE